MTVYVTPDAVDAIVRDAGFTYRDRGLMLSALGAPMPVFGNEVYPSLHEKAAVLMLAVNRSHPLLDGNKRTSWYLVTFFYAENGYVLQPGNPLEADTFIRFVAAGRVKLGALASWLAARAQAAAR